VGGILRQAGNETALDKAKHYMQEHGVDMPEITDRFWSS
jgi:phosphoketolase